MCMNLHSHDIEIYTYTNEEKFYKLFLTLPKFEKSTKLDKNSKDLFCICCQKCNILENDFKIHDRIEFGEKQITGSCFETENGTWTIGKNKPDSFLEYNGTLLIGDTKIISFFDEMKNINTEKDNKISDLSTKNNSLEESLEEKNNEINDLSTKNNSLEKSIEQSNKDIKMKDSQIEEMKNSLSIEKNNNQNIEKNLQTEKEKNNELKSKLENISLVNNENVKKVLEQVENEKKKNENLESKISELKDKEKELEDIKKKNPQNFGLKF